MQAGFIGAWGEWHSSTNGLDNAEDRRDILLAILGALPASRMVQIRTPHFKEQIFGTGTIAAEEAFRGSAKARTGHHNDAFLASSTDFGTYQSPIETWKDYVAQDGRFTPIGGETSAYNPPRSDGSSADVEMARLHWSYCNIDYHPDVIASWASQGYLERIRSRLGYRFSLLTASWTEAVVPGGVLDLSLHFQNDGYAAPFNERPVYVLLRGGSVSLSAPLSVDVRRWEAGTNPQIVTRLRIPADVPDGTYALSLWMPDAYPSLRQRPEYSIRLANEGVWDAADGTNLVSDQIRIDSSAGGPTDSQASLFEEVR